MRMIDFILATLPGVAVFGVIAYDLVERWRENNG